GRRELDDPEAVVEREVGVELPSEARVEAPRALDLRDRNDDDFELQIDGRRAGGRRDRLTAPLSGTHLQPPCVMPAVITFAPPRAAPSSRRAPPGFRRAPG